MQQRHDPIEETVSSGEASCPTAPDQLQTDAEAATTSPAEKQKALKEDMKAIYSEETRQGVRRMHILLKWFGPPLAWVCVFGPHTEWNTASPLFCLVAGPPTVWFWGYFFKLLIASGREKDPTQERIKKQCVWARRVAGQSDIHTLGLLVDAYGMGLDQKTHEVVIRALTSLLPRLQVDDAPLLQASDRTKLCAVLSLREDHFLNRDLFYLFRTSERDSRTIEFYIAILQALKQVGGKEALPVVRQLATAEAKTQGDRRIQQEAIACLPVLEQRIQLSQSSKTLLRASDAPGMAADTLLRAATGSPEVVPEELLRASTSEPDCE